MQAFKKSIVTDKTDYLSNQNFYHFYVGIDIGYKFHVGACISLEELKDPKGSWRRKKTIKINSTGEGILGFLKTLKHIAVANSLTPCVTIVVVPLMNTYSKKREVEVTDDG